MKLELRSHTGAWRTIFCKCENSVFAILAPTIFTLKKRTNKIITHIFTQLFLSKEHDKPKLLGTTVFRRFLILLKGNLYRISKIKNKNVYTYVSADNKGSHLIGALGCSFWR